MRGRFNVDRRLDEFFIIRRLNGAAAQRKRPGRRLGRSHLDADHRRPHVYRKALYREYSDSTFTVRKPRPPEWEHLGYLGPVIRGTVGDTIRIIFKNNAAMPYTMHPHGVFYDKRTKDHFQLEDTTEVQFYSVVEREGLN